MTKKGALYLLLAFSVFSLSSNSATHRSAPRAAAECKDWSYYGANGPKEWPKLFPEDCAKSHQSPVDIVNSRPRATPPISFDYESTAFEVIREHYGVQINYKQKSSITYDGTTYDLKQFHFHLPGEHEVSNKGFVMEMHLVHKTPDEKQAAVVGVLFRVQAADNPALKPIVDNLPPPGSDRGGSGPAINAINLVPGIRAYYRYGGSLTTPCCTEGVLWLVLGETVPISRAQLQKFEISQENKHNNRPVQRTIQADK